MIWMRLRKLPAKGDGVIMWRTLAQLPFPSSLSKDCTLLRCFTLFFYFLFLAVREQSKTTHTLAYVYMWTCLLSDRCFVILWNIPHFTLCTSLNKVYEFIAVYCDAVRAVIVDDFVKH